MSNLQLFKKKHVLAFLFLFSSLILFSNDKTKTFIATNSHIKIVGRVDFSNPDTPVFSASGSYIIANFRGTFCELIIKDEHKWGKNRNYFQVIVDNKPAVRFQTEIGKTNYLVATNLEEGMHTIKIIKDSEGSIGFLQFLGIKCEDLLPPPVLSSRKIECYGNSITCGSGTIVSLCDSSKDSNWYLSTSAYFSYGYLLAEKLNAQFHLTSQSGIGLIHSCCNMPNTMMDSYDRIHIDKADGPKWEFSKYIPDVVTIALGQNDGIQDSALFSGKYIEFVKTLRSKYPQAGIFLLTSPMSDDTLLEYQKMILNTVVDFLKKEGDKNVYKIILPNKLNSGCTTHPDAEQHKIVAEELSKEIKRVMNW